MSEGKVGRETDGWMGAVTALTRTLLLVHNGQKPESEASGQDAILPSPCGDPSAESGTLHRPHLLPDLLYECLSILLK